MALRNFRPQTETLLDPDGTLITSLTLSDVTLLIDAHWDEMKSIYDFYQGIQSSAEVDEKVNQTILECVRVAPDLAASLIALSAGEPDAQAQAKSLPFTVQIDALVKIVNLTLREVGGLGNFSAVLRSAVAGLKAAKANATPPKHDAAFAVCQALHGYGAYTRLALIVLHIAGGVKHRVVDKGGDTDVLPRML